MRCVMKSIKSLFLILSALILCVALSGCSKGFNRGLEDAMGSLNRQHVELLGAPGKECELVKMRVSGSYAVFMKGYTIRLGDEYPNVRTVLQFSDGRADYAVLECGKEDGALKHVLLEIPQSASSLATYILHDTSNKPFRMSSSSQYITLLQDVDSSKDTRAWYIDRSGLRGPILLSARGGKKQTKTSSGNPRSSAARQAKKNETPQLSEIPIISPSASARLENDGRSPEGTLDGASKNSARSPDSAPLKPVVVVDTPNDATTNSNQAEPQSQSPAPSTPKPVIVIGAPKNL